jgi:riboflavin kinase/FMN adenylyltransferase
MMRHELARVQGAVHRGAGRGKSLGFPTANVEVSAGELPAAGIYAVWVAVPGRAGWRKGAASVGYNPTFGEGGTLRLEVHLLGHSGELYGKTLTVVFVSRLRGERRFESAAALTEQLRSDCAQAEQLLGDENRPL